MKNIKVDSVLIFSDVVHYYALAMCSYLCCVYMYIQDSLLEESDRLKGHFLSKSIYLPTQIILDLRSNTCMTNLSVYFC